MFWYILCCVLAIGIIAWAIWAETPTILILLVLVAVLTFYVYVVNVFNTQSMNAFTMHKEYISQHKPADIIENAALTNKKIELNEWLYNAQFMYEEYTFFTLYPKEVMELEPIQ